MPQASDYLGTAFSPGQTIYYSYNLGFWDLWTIGGPYAFNMTQSAYQAKVANAFAQWEALANVTFQQTTSFSQADIGVYWHTTDGTGGTAGYALPLDNDGDGLIEHGTEGVLLGMDPYDAYAFDKIILHEIGHALGLGHNTHTNSVMAPYYENMSATITSYDVAVVQSIYGAPGGGATTDPIYSGTSAADLLVGSAGADVFYGGAGVDTVTAGDGADLVYGNLEADLLSGGGGSDTIFGGQNNGPADGTGIQRNGIETVYGGAGDDLLYGNMGGDALWGESGNDTLFGGQDSDRLYGGAGDDALFGNLGSDQFHYNATGEGNEGHDTIYGWGAGDSFGLHNAAVTSSVNLDDRVRVTLDTGTVIDVIGATDADLRYDYFT